MVFAVHLYVLVDRLCIPAQHDSVGKTKQPRGLRTASALMLSHNINSLAAEFTLHFGVHAERLAISSTDGAVVERRDAEAAEAVLAGGFRGIEV